MEPPDLDNPDILTLGRSELPGTNRRDQQIVRSWTKTSDIFFEPFQPHIHPIFLVNRKLSSDAAIVLARTKANYHLDIILLNEVSLLPTWLMLPKPASQVETLTCTFRIAGSAPPRAEQREYRGFGTAGSAIAWVIYSLLEHFLWYGPSFGYTSKGVSNSVADIHPGYSIGNLVIDVETPPGIHPDQMGVPMTGSYGHGQHPRMDDGKMQPRVLDPLYLIDFIDREITRLLRMDYYTFEYGNILFENVGNIIFKLDGQIQSTRDLGAILQDLSPGYEIATTSKAERIQKFQNWKPLAIARRSTLGLSTENVGLD